MTPHTEHATSVRRRLLSLLLAPLALLLGTGILIDYISASKPIPIAYDQALVNSALAVAAHVQVDEAGHISAVLSPGAEAVLRSDRYDTIYYLVIDPRGEFVAGDRGLPVASSATRNPSYLDAVFRGDPIRVASYRTQTSAGPVTVSVAETRHKRDHGRRRVLASLFATDLVQLAGTLLLVWIGVRYGLRPLTALRDQIAARSARDLAALDVAPVPLEVRPLVHALNRLFETVREAADAQQQFLANAAHQLRTPLGGIMAQLDLLARDPAAAAVRERVLALREGSRRAAHTANRLLALARAEPSALVAGDIRSVDLRALVADAVAAQLDRALAAHIDLGVEAEVVRVPASDWLLRELLANLVDNALTYTPIGGRITLRCGNEGDGAFLEVEDDGPGIPPAERARVLERFYRAPGAPGNGCGLGLAIVDEIARLHGAHLVIAGGAEGRGTRIRLRFPRVV
ncbi:sensor histidine kinase [Dokdonella soli]|uniref:histidine kinase n=1 Tax=Dokdonella soli TaxID=529810 RepID=A0ABN1IPA5_9GAMM